MIRYHVANKQSPSIYTFSMHLSYSYQSIILFRNYSTEQKIMCLNLYSLGAWIEETCVQVYKSVISLYRSCIN